MTSGGRVGFEIEFAGLSAPEAAEAACAVLGGSVARESDHVATVEDTPLGRLRFELDTRYSRPAKQPGLVDQALDSMDLRVTAANFLATLVPIELVTPPVPREAFDQVDRLVDALRASGAKGTYDNNFSAFGLHLNVEIDPPDPARAIRISAAFAFVEPWLRRQIPLDITRRVTPFIDPYPAGYAEALAEAVAAGSLPALGPFIALYGRWNPSRNRGLDLWPLLGHLSRPHAEAALGQPVKNARPAFHYRLPDSRVSEPGWSPLDEVVRWDAVERVADDAEALGRAARASAALHGWRDSRARYDAKIAELIG